MKLRNKIHLYSSVMFAVLLIIMNASIYFLFSKMSTDSALNQTDDEARAVADGLSRWAGELPEAELLRAYMPVAGMLSLVSPDHKSHVAVTSPSEQRLGSLPAVYYDVKTVTTFYYKENYYALASVPVIWNDGNVMNVQVTESMESVMDRLAVLRIVLLVVTVVALIPVILSGRLLGSVIMRPITVMTSTMTDIQRSGAFKRLKQEGGSKDELYAMGETFNGMIDLLESNYERQKQFVSNASHELKTPLTVIESYSSLLLRKGKERPELYEESLRAIHSEAVRMKEMTEQLLLLAKHKEQWSIDIRETNLCALVEGSVQAFRSAYEREVQIVAPSDPITANTDENKLKQMLYIFMDNARKYSEDAIIVKVEAKGDDRVIAVQDRGIGIPQHDMDKVFDRFYRVDEARSRKDGGSGLGLSLAQEIADAIGAHIDLRSLEGLGTTVTITLSGRYPTHAKQ